MFKPANILVATDFSSESDHALATAVDLAGKYHANIDLLYVLDEVEQCSADYCMPQEEFESLRARVMKEAQKKLRKEIKCIAGDRRMKINQSIRFGNHVDEILREVDEKNIDLLVMAPHEHHKPWHALIGHMTDNLMKRSKCEMLLVR